MINNIYKQNQTQSPMRNTTASSSSPITPGSGVRKKPHLNGNTDPSETKAVWFIDRGKNSDFSESKSQSPWSSDREKKSGKRESSTLTPISKLQESKDNEGLSGEQVGVVSILFCVCVCFKKIIIMMIFSGLQFLFLLYVDSISTKMYFNF